MSVHLIQVLSSAIIVHSSCHFLNLHIWGQANIGSVLTQKFMILITTTQECSVHNGKPNCTKNADFCQYLIYCLMTCARVHHFVVFTFHVYYIGNEQVLNSLF